MEEVAVRLQVVARAFLVMRMMQALREVDMEAKEVRGKVAREVEALSWDTKALIAVRRHPGGCCCGLAPHHCNQVNKNYLTGLLSLNLSSNSLSGELPSQLLFSRSIAILDVSFNNLNGDLPKLPSSRGSAMQVINISSNLFTGQIPSTTLESTTNLASLNMSNNSFTGQILSTICVNKPFFAVLDLSFNQFNGSIPAELGNCSALRVLKAVHNKISGTLPDELYNATSLEHLSFPNNLLQGALSPELIVKLGNLVILDLAENGLTGKIPDSIGQLKRLEELHLEYNSMSGELPSTLSKCSNLTTIILRSNSFHGELKKVNFSTLSNLKNLDFMLNKFTGTVPESLYFCNNLIALRLSSNKLHGQLSPGLGNLKSLKFLSLSNNSFTNITNAFQVLKNSGNLTTLLIGTNFKGNIPHWPSKLRNLREIFLYNNQLTGPIPVWIKSLSLLSVIDISNNRLAGEIPTALMEMPMLQSEKISYQVVFQLPVYTTPSLQYRKVNYCPKLLNLGDNELTGVIPPEIGHLKALTALNLSFNNFHGEVPQSIGNLTNLQVLDLSNNHLTGAIPAALENLHFLSDFNISNNDIEGPIPTGGQFSTYPDSSFVGNPKMCGPMLIHHCNSVEAGPAPNVSTELWDGYIVFAVAFGAFVGVGVLYDQMVLSRYFG
ncbi:receptor-like protein 3 [Phragmites australis]|uniref:receptor-like protein 3 n=1 Tax=Phragmites australis TaxID=29695 RepID=UPI002D77E3C0|nr:receptor-like protein 3 [Phragmites australis]